MSKHMSRTFTKGLIATCLTLGAVLGAGPAVSNSFPTETITIVSPFPPGGAVDALARLVGEQLGKELDQSVIVENRAGASTVIGASYVSRARPDGHTLLLATNTTMVTNRFLHKDLSYDADTFEPVAMLGVVPMVMLGSKKSDFTDFTDLSNYVKDGPETLTIASVGVGTTSHLVLERLRQMADAEINHVPFSGAAQILPALVNGDVDAFFDTLSTGMPQAESGTVNALAITSRERSPSYPDVPTIAEMGYPDFDMNIWFSLVAPANTPPEALTALNDAVKRALDNPELQQRIAGLGIQPTDPTPALLTEQIQREVPIIGQIVENANIEKN